MYLAGRQHRLGIVLALAAATVGLLAQSADLDGHWSAASGVAFAPWAFDFKVEGRTLKGTASQNRVDEASGFATNASGPFEIEDGRIDGGSISFTLRTPDGGRVITFNGIRSGDQIAFTRDVRVLRGDPGRDGILGASGARQFTARLDRAAPANTTAGTGATATVSPSAAGSRYIFKGVTVDAAAIQAAPNRDAVLDSLRRQIDIVDDVKLDSGIRDFLKSVPIVLQLGEDRPTDSPGTYVAARRLVTLRAQIYERDRPILLHELLHAYHAQQLPNGMGNAEIRSLFQQARDRKLFPADSYMLSNPSEYFAMVASVFLHGSAARDPFTRDNLKKTQPDCYRWLEREFGPR